MTLSTGLYELALFSALLAGAVLLLRTPRRPGWIVGVVAIGHAVPRFFLDFLRREATDPRYAGLTPAPWSCVATLVAAVALFAWSYTTASRRPSATSMRRRGASTSATSSGSAAAPQRRLAEGVSSRSSFRRARPGRRAAVAG